MNLNEDQQHNVKNLANEIRASVSRLCQTEEMTVNQVASEGLIIARANDAIITILNQFLKPLEENEK